MHVVSSLPMTYPLSQSHVKFLCICSHMIGSVLCRWANEGVGTLIECNEPGKVTHHQESKVGKVVTQTCDNAIRFQLITIQHGSAIGSPVAPATLCMICVWSFQSYVCI